MRIRPLLWLRRSKRGLQRALVLGRASDSMAIDLSSGVSREVANIVLTIFGISGCWGRRGHASGGSGSTVRGGRGRVGSIWRLPDGNGDWAEDAKGTAVIEDPELANRHACPGLAQCPAQSAWQQYLLCRLSAGEVPGDCWSCWAVNDMATPGGSGYVPERRLPSAGTRVVLLMSSTLHHCPRVEQSMNVFCP